MRSIDTDDGRWEGEFIVKNGEFIDELVRCKDCVYFDDSCQPIYGGWCRQLMQTNGDIVTYHVTTEHDFCSSGIRRKDETN